MICVSVFSIIPRYRKVVVPSTHTTENHDFISSDQGADHLSNFLLVKDG